MAILSAKHMCVTYTKPHMQNFAVGPPYFSGEIIMITKMPNDRIIIWYPKGDFTGYNWSASDKTSINKSNTPRILNHVWAREFLRNPLFWGGFGSVVCVVVLVSTGWKANPIWRIGGGHHGLNRLTMDWYTQYPGLPSTLWGGIWIPKNRYL